jgi:hypothetical protein
VIVQETGARTHMHPLDIPMAESGGPFRPVTPTPGLLRRVLCKLKYCPSLAALKLFIRLGTARDRSRYYGVPDECCSPAMCA